MAARWNNEVNILQLLMNVGVNANKVAVVTSISLKRRPSGRLIGNRNVTTPLHDVMSLRDAC